MNLHRHNYKWVVLQRYVTGNISDEEKRIVEKRMAVDPEYRKLVEEVKEIWKLTPKEKFEVNVRDAWKHYQDRQKRAPLRIKSLEYTSQTSKGNLVHVLRAAAVLLVAFFSGYFVQHHIATTEQLAAEEANNFNVMQELETDKGDKARITFLDGTKVTLNSSSSLRFPKEFHESTREVYLIGEAYFEVASDPGRPFIVHALNTTIEVLGTGFNVRGWEEDPGVEVIVREGRVAIKASDHEQVEESSDVILTEGFYTKVSRGQSPIQPRQVDVRKYLLWASGGMHFDHTAFAQVVRDIKRRFNVEITVTNEDLLEVPYTGTFQYADLDEVLSVIAVSIGLDYERDGMSVEFSPTSPTSLEAGSKVNF